MSIISSGICWGTNPNPTIANDKTNDGIGLDLFTSVLHALIGGTTYYVRAYQQSDSGTIYGNEISFQTSGSVVPPPLVCPPGQHEENGVCVPNVPPPPTGLTTSPVTSIAQTTAVSGGVGSGSQRGVCWSHETDQPELDSRHTTDGAGSGAFVSKMTNLQPDYRYFVRAYATNNGITTFGQAIQFWTLPSSGGLTCPPGQHLENGVCVNDDIVVPPDTGTGVVVCDGDSRTVGYDGDDFGGFHPYSDLINVGNLDVYNTATGGLTMQQLIDRDVVNQYLTNGTNVLIIWGGVNDFWQLNPTAQQVYDKIKLYCLLKRSAGWKVIVCSEVSIPEAGEDIDNKRWAMNEMIRQNWRTFADGFADLGADPRIGALGAYENPAYFIGIHETEAGYHIVYEIIQKALDSFFVTPPEPPISGGMQLLKVDGHYLATEDVNPFFYLADTGWLMMYKLTMSEIGFYLDKRKSQGFNAIQIMLLSSRNERTDDGIPANRQGNYPFHNRNSGNGMNGDPLQPNEAFWSFVDQAVALAESKGMYLCLLPVWGHAVDPQSPYWANDSNLLFPNNSTGIQRAGAYCQWLGNRYKGYNNIIWMLGGDRKAVRDGVDYRPVWDAMAEGLLRGRSNYLITYHSQGGISSGGERSSTWFNNRHWLSFNTFQSGHGRDRKEYILEDWVFGKPTYDSEACYRNIDLSDDGSGDLVSPHDVRKSAYRSVFEGGFGYVYGELGVFQFFDGTDPWFSVNQVWRNTIDDESAWQMGYLKSLMVAHPYQVNDSSILSNYGSGASRRVACKGGNWRMVYIPDGQSVTVYLSNNVTAKWFNPRNGQTIPIGNIAMNTGSHVFTPPETGADKDWVLIIVFI
jgi:hypothetical protein